MLGYQVYPAYNATFLVCISGDDWSHTHWEFPTEIEAHCFGFNACLALGSH